MRAHALLLFFTLGLAVSPGLRAHDHARAEGAAPGAARVVLPDVPLVDASGNRVRLARDVIGERIAVVNFIYTTCTTICPVASATFQQLQKRLAGTLGKDVVLVTLSVDPLRDTPQRLREHAGRWQAREGWVWLTGAKPDVDSTLKGFGAYTPRFEDHPPMILIGDARAGRWTRFFGFPAVEQLLAQIETLRAAKLAHHQAKE